MKTPFSEQMDGFFRRAMNPMRWLMANTVTYSSLAKRKFVFIDNMSSLDFITTDQPVINVYASFGKNPVEMSENEFELYCPFSPKKAILVSFKDCYSKMCCIKAYEEDVKIYNNTLVDCSNRFVFSKERMELSQWLK